MTDKQPASSLTREKAGTLGLAQGLWLVPGLLLMLCLSMSLIVSGVRLVQNIVAPPVLVAVSGICYAAFLGLGLWLAGQSRFPISEARFTAGLCGAALLVRLLVLLWRADYIQVGDHAQLREFVLRLAAGGLTPANMRSLSSLYDYPVWLSRAFPIYLPLRWAFAEHDLLAVQLVNAFLSTGCVLLTLLIGRSLFPPPIHRLAATLMALLPLHIVEVLSYSVQIPGTLLFMLAVYLALGWVRGEPLSVGTLAVRGLAYGSLMFLLRIQRGLDFLLLPLLAVLAVVSWTSYSRRSAVRLSIILFFALLAYVPAASKHGKWMRQYDTHRMRSHTLGFMSRGLNPVTWGEYLERFEQIDVATQPADKRRVLGGIIVSQLVRRPGTTLVLLPAVKVAKLFLVGYASGVEQGFEWAGSPGKAAIVRGARLFFAPPFLLLTLLGTWWWVRRGTWVRTETVLLWAPVITCVATTWLGETSPRYSHPVHFALALVASIGIAACVRRLAAMGPAVPRRHLASASAVVLSVYVLLAGGSYVVARLWGTDLLFEDMRGASRRGACAPAVTEHSISHLEQRLDLCDGPDRAGCFVEGQLSLDGLARERSDVSLFVFAESPRRSDLSAFGVSVWVGGHLEARARCSELEHGRRFVMRWSPSAVTNRLLRVRVEPEPSAARAEGLHSVTVRWGYVRLSPGSPG